MVVNGMPGLAGKPDRHVSPSSLQRGDGDAWRQSARTQVDRGGANLPPLSCRPQIRVSLPWSVTRGCQHPSSGWKMPPFVEGQDEEDFVPAKTLTGNERWCAALLHCHPSLARRQTENRVVSTQRFVWACQPNHTHCIGQRNVYFVQYVFLPTEQAETYPKICVLIYHLTYICPSLFGWNDFWGNRKFQILNRQFPP